MPKIHYFSNKIKKIAKAWGPQQSLNLRFWWPEVM